MGVVTKTCREGAAALSTPVEEERSLSSEHSVMRNRLTRAKWPSAWKRRAIEKGKRHTSPRPASPLPSSHLNAPEDAVGMYSVLGTTEDGRRVVVTLIPCAVAANTKKGQQGSGRSTGAIWKCSSVAEGMFLKRSQDNDSWLLHPCTRAALETGLWEGRGRSTITSPPRSPPSHSGSHRSAVWVYPLRRAGKRPRGRTSFPASCLPSSWQD